MKKTLAILAFLPFAAHAACIPGQGQWTVGTSTASLAVCGADGVTWAPVGGSSFSGAYADLTGKPILGTAAATAITDYATAAQGAIANSALQPGGNAATATALQTPRTINGVSFNGTANITISAADAWTYLAVNGGSDFTTSSATAVDVTGLAFTPVLNTKYEFECTIALRSATATVNPRVGLMWPTGLTDGVAMVTVFQAATGTPLFAAGNPNAALLTAVGGLPNTTQSWPAMVRATVNAGASPSGTVRIQLASETAATNVTIRNVGSFCRYRSYI